MSSTSSIPSPSAPVQPPPRPTSKAVPENSPVRNPTLAHLRPDCEHHRFEHHTFPSALPVNVRHCLRCYCVVCDVPVSACKHWPLHSAAFFTHPLWRAVRKLVRRRSGVVPLIPMPLVYVNLRHVAKYKRLLTQSQNLPFILLEQESGTVHDGDSQSFVCVSDSANGNHVDTCNEQSNNLKRSHAHMTSGINVNNNNNNNNSNKNIQVQVPQVPHHIHNDSLLTSTQCSPVQEQEQVYEEDNRPSKICRLSLPITPPSETTSCPPGTAPARAATATAPAVTPSFIDVDHFTEQQTPARQLSTTLTGKGKDKIVKNTHSIKKSNSPIGIAILNDRERQPYALTAVAATELRNPADSDPAPTPTPPSSLPPVVNQAVPVTVTVLAVGSKVNNDNSDHLSRVLYRSESTPLSSSPRTSIGNNPSVGNNHVNYSSTTTSNGRPPQFPPSASKPPATTTSSSNSTFTVPVYSSSSSKQAAVKHRAVPTAQRPIILSMSDPHAIPSNNNISNAVTTPSIPTVAPSPAPPAALSSASPSQVPPIGHNPHVQGSGVAPHPVIRPETPDPRAVVSAAIVHACPRSRSLDLKNPHHLPHTLPKPSAPTVAQCSKYEPSSVVALDDIPTKPRPDAGATSNATGTRHTYCGNLGKRQSVEQVSSMPKTEPSLAVSGLGSGSRSGPSAVGQSSILRQKLISNGKTSIGGVPVNPGCTISSPSGISSTPTPTSTSNPNGGSINNNAITFATISIPSRYTPSLVGDKQHIRYLCGTDLPRSNFSGSHIKSGRGSPLAVYNHILCNWSPSHLQYIPRSSHQLSLGASLTPGAGAVQKKKVENVNNDTTITPLSPSRILVGSVTLWRPFCSHLSARIRHPLGSNFEDVDNLVGYQSFSHVECASSKLHAAVTVMEMGLRLEKPETLRDARDVLFGRGSGTGHVRNENEQKEQKQGEGLELRDSDFQYRWDDGTPIDQRVLGALRKCSDQKLIEIRWEVVHHEGASNNCRALTSCHRNFFHLPKDILAHYTDTQDRHLAQRVKTLQSLMKDSVSSKQAVLNHSNCCALKAWIFLTPNAFVARTSPAAAACALSSPYASMSLLSSGQQRTTICDELLTSECAITRALASERQQWRGIHSRRAISSEELGILLSVMTPVNQPDVMDRRLPTKGDAARVGSVCIKFKGYTLGTIINGEKLLRKEFMRTAEEHENRQNSINVVLSSLEFGVSKGYRTEVQPHGIKLTLRPYQLDSLAWMLDQEKKRSISDPFWIRLMGKDPNGGIREFHYCPFSATLSRFVPPPVVGGILADEMGLGKTIVVIALIIKTLPQARAFTQFPRPSRPDLTRSRATLIICPVSLLKQWEAEFNKCVGCNLSVTLWYGTNRRRDLSHIANHDVVITTYGILSSGHCQELSLIHWNRVIIDESTYLNGGGSNCSTKLCRLVSFKRWCVSGTPFGDNFAHFQAALSFLCVTPFSSSKEFDVLGQVMNVGKGSYYPRLVYGCSFLQYFFKNMMIRHVKAQTLRGKQLVSLPTASGRIVIVKHTPTEAELYREFDQIARNRASRFLKLTNPAGMSVLQLNSFLQPLRQLADGVVPKEEWRMCQKIASPKNPNASTIPMSRIFELQCKRHKYVALMESRGSKINQLVRDFRQYCARDPTTKFVVFTEFQEVQSQIKLALNAENVPVFTLQGHMTGTKRGDVLKQFEQSSKPCVLALSLRLGACGLTLTMANIVVLLEVGLDIATEQQAVNRVHRIGQTRHVETLTYVAEGTIDERMIQVRKRQGKIGFIGETSANSTSSNTQRGGRDLSNIEKYRMLFNYT